MKASVLIKSHTPLRTERTLRGWSQARLAETLGVTIRTVRRWELGQAIPFPNYRQQLSSLFGKTAQELGLLPYKNEHNAIQQAFPAVAQPNKLGTPASASCLIDPAIVQTLGSTKSLLGRHGLVTLVKERLLAADPLTFTALYGLPGSGKTALAMTLFTDQQIRAHFRNGILWAGLGQEPNVLGQLARWGTLLGVAPSDVENPKSYQAWGRALRSAIGNRQMLLVIDDAWTIEDALALQIGGVQCTYLLTTRHPYVAFTFAQQRSIFVPQLEEIARLALLSRFVPHLVLDDPQGARSLAQAVSGLPLALTLMGNALASSTFSGDPWPLRTALGRLRLTEKRLRVSIPTTCGEGWPSFAETVLLSLYATIAICDQQLGQQTHAALCALATFLPKPHSFSEEAALVMSRQPRETLDELRHAGLLEYWGPRRYCLHQTIADYARARVKFQ
jgi:DNA-binding XRE family transcriptional regulator